MVKIGQIYQNRNNGCYFKIKEIKDYKFFFFYKYNLGEKEWKCDGNWILKPEIDDYELIIDTLNPEDIVSKLSKIE